MIAIGFRYGIAKPRRHAASRCLSASNGTELQTSTMHAVRLEFGPSVEAEPQITSGPAAILVPRTSIVLAPETMSEHHGSRTTRQRIFMDSIRSNAVAVSATYITPLMINT